MTGAAGPNMTLCGSNEKASGALSIVSPVDCRLYGKSLGCFLFMIIVFSAKHYVWLMVATQGYLLI